MMLKGEEAGMSSQLGAGTPAATAATLLLPHWYPTTLARRLPHAWVCRAIFLIQKLTSSKEEMKESLPRGTESMPAAELHFCRLPRTHA